MQKDGRWKVGRQTHRLKELSVSGWPKKSPIIASIILHEAEKFFKNRLDGWKIHGRIRA